MSAARNPFAPHTPEWQLFANLEGERTAMATYIADVERATTKVETAREKIRLYAEALEKLTGASK